MSKVCSNQSEELIEENLQAVDLSGYDLICSQAVFPVLESMK